MRITLTTTCEVTDSGADWDRFWIDIISDTGVQHGAIEISPQMYARLMAAQKREDDRFRANVSLTGVF